MDQVVLAERSNSIDGKIKGISEKIRRVENRGYDQKDMAICFDVYDAAVVTQRFITGHR